MEGGPRSTSLLPHARPLCLFSHTRCNIARINTARLHGRSRNVFQRLFFERTYCAFLLDTVTFDVPDATSFFFLHATVSCDACVADDGPHEAAPLQRQRNLHTSRSRSTRLSSEDNVWSCARLRVAESNQIFEKRQFYSVSYQKEIMSVYIYGALFGMYTFCLRSFQRVCRSPCLPLDCSTKSASSTAMNVHQIVRTSIGDLPMT